MRKVIRASDMLRSLGVVVFGTFLASCQVQWVSPYSASLQSKATTMLAEVSAWEIQMKAAAGTPAADPRNPAVIAQLSKWHGEIEAISQIELSIDPGSTACDAFLKQTSQAVSGVLSKLPTGPALDAAGSVGLSAPKPITHCETLPGIFTRMIKQVDATIPLVLGQQCHTSQSDGYFQSLGSTGAAGAADPSVVKTCQPLFQPPAGTAHGNLLDSLIVDLDAVIYREGREAPQASN